jgi:RNA polymerase sigma-70 factor (ECF subfamily)
MNLISRALAGDNGAFEELFEQYRNLVYKTATLMLDDPQDAEDVLQEVFVRVYRSLDTYDPSRGAFTTWLHRLTTNACLNWHRRRKRRPRLVDMSRVDPSRLTQPSSDVRAAESMDVRAALRGLNDRLRVTVVLRYGWDMTYAEIARVLDLPVGTVKSRLHRALNLLAVGLNSEGEGTGLQSILQAGEVKHR